MSQCFLPRLSAATHLLPLLRNQLLSAASGPTWASGLTLELLPIVEDGLFGYELVPERETHTYVTIGCNAHGEPVVRNTSYGMGASNAMQLVAVNGHVLSPAELAARYSTHQRDTRFPDWSAAAEAAWARLLVLFPERPRRPVVLSENAHRSLEQALSVAYSHLVRWDPYIQFCGVPNEAQQGFALEGGRGEHGELVFQRPDIWMLRWKAPPHAVYESWSVVLPELDTTRNVARGDLESKADIR